MVVGYGWSTYFEKKTDVCDERVTFFYGRCFDLAMWFGNMCLFWFVMNSDLMNQPYESWGFNDFYWSQYWSIWFQRSLVSSRFLSRFFDVFCSIRRRDWRFQTFSQQIRLEINDGPVVFLHVSSLFQSKHMGISYWVTSVVCQQVWLCATVLVLGQPVVDRSNMKLFALIILYTFSCVAWQRTKGLLTTGVGVSKYLVTN